MLRQRSRTAAESSPLDRPIAGAIDAVHVRNYDHEAGHSVQLAIEDTDGRVRHTERCYLGPGQSRRVAAAVVPGEYLIRIRVDGLDRRRTRCRLAGAPDRTAVVELGNGVVSVTEGADGLTPAL